MWHRTKDKVQVQIKSALAAVTAAERQNITDELHFFYVVNDFDSTTAEDPFNLRLQWPSCYKCPVLFTHFPVEAEP